MDNVSAQSGSRHPSSEGDSGNVRNSPYVMQGNIGPNPASDIAEGKRFFLEKSINFFIHRSVKLFIFPFYFLGYSNQRHVTNSPYSRVTVNGWPPREPQGCTEGYTRATAIFGQNLEDLRPPQLNGGSTRPHAP